MLRLHNISKIYTVADKELDALKDVSVSFRKSEFVSILGPSGCGKTTTLNIIGGLDKYTSGDLFINGISTKEFTSRDWDIYRNHRVGFIFQSYNLIPHQTVISNVELALTISGVSKAEREKRAKKALDRVGLEGQYYKKPNQLSGGQCQRVAIARALVNEPEILLADEPTGALDTTTSIQIMDLIKEIAKDKLVIMVTHNPELAEKYSTRIITLLDGKITADTNPLSTIDEINEVRDNKNESKIFKSNIEKAKMSLGTAFKLSFKNLFTKRKRTALTCIAGSIGIIGISMVLAVSSGVKGYIASMQDDMLSGNPITIKETALDMSKLISFGSDSFDFVKDPSLIYVSPLVKEAMESGDGLITNNITQDYIDYILGLNSEDVSQILLDYGIDVGYNFYTDFKVSSTSSPINTSINVIKENYISLVQETEYAKYASYINNYLPTFSEAPTNSDYIKSQYNLIHGDLATKENEIMLVLDNNQAAPDVLLAQLGFITQDDFIKICDKSYTDISSIKLSDLINKEFTYYSNSQIYQKNTDPVTSSFFPFNYASDPKNIEGNGLKIKISGILQPKENISYGCLSSGFYYTNALTKKILADTLESEIYKYYIDNNITTINTALVNNTFVPDEKGSNIGIPYTYSYTYGGITSIKKCYVGTYTDYSFMGGYMGAITGSGSTTESSLDITARTLSLRSIGGINVANSISIYPINFEKKANITSYLDAWNNDDTVTLPNGTEITSENRSKIVYTDSIELIITMINSMVDVVTYALIAFTALSLLVSCVMIAIITYVSVMERVKEIGVIRSLGGRKKDVSHLFNAETLIIGSISGIFGIAVTYILSLIVNALISSLAGINNICALPWYQALIMIILSILLTSISGLIPAKNAAKKDPVTALRSE